MQRIVITGASLAGLSAAEALRGRGYDADLVVVGAEKAMPYDRPPLSKEILRGDSPPEASDLRPPDAYENLAVDWRLGQRATSLDPGAKTVTLDGAETIPYDGLVIATGASPRWIPGTTGRGGVHVLRSLDDCLALRDEFGRTPRVCIVGAGFIGAEVAASARQLGLDVTMLEALPTPLGRALPPVIGEAIAGLHSDHGVDVRCGVGVEAFEGSDRVERVRLTSGDVVDADVVVLGVGVAPNTDWLESSGLPLADGVVCDATCATPAPGVVAAGDVARWPNPLFGEVMRVEHWTNATDQGRAAALTLLDGSGAQPFAPVPYFWSDQYDLKIQFVGRATQYDEFVVVDGSFAEGAAAGLFGRAGKLVGALAFNRPRLLMKYRKLIAQSTGWDEALSL